MNRLFCVLFFAVMVVTASAQSSLTLSFAGNGFSHTGVGLKYTRDYSKLLVTAYGAAFKGGLLVIGDQSWPSNNGVVGISLNKLYDSTIKNPGFYYGVSVEASVQNYKAKNASIRYTDFALLAGPQLGLNVSLSKSLSFNAEWGLRAGVKFGHVRHNVFRGITWVRDFYTRENTMFIYIPTSIGLTYTLGRKRKHTAE